MVDIRYREAKTQFDVWSDWHYKTIGEQHTQVYEFYAAFKLFTKRNVRQLNIEYANGSALQIEVAEADTIEGTAPPDAGS